MEKFIAISPDNGTEGENDVPNIPPIIKLTLSQYNELCDSAKYGATGNRSFIGCALRFCGDENREKTEEFIKSIEIYKKMGNISDEDAVLTFPLLLTGSASTWWQSLSAGIKTWLGLTKTLRCAFAPDLQPHEVYMKVFSTPQKEDEPTCEFVDRKRALLCQLPPNLSLQYDENQQLDLIYGLLNLNIREKIVRSDIMTFHWLIERARHFESIDAEKLQQKKKSQKRDY